MRPFSWSSRGAATSCAARSRETCSKSKPQARQNCCAPDIFNPQLGQCIVFVSFDGVKSAYDFDSSLVQLMRELARSLLLYSFWATRLFITARDQHLFVE